MTDADHRRLVALSEWDALTEATRKATAAKHAAAAIHEHQTSIREAILRALAEEN